MKDKIKIREYLKSLDKPKILIIREGLIGDVVFITPLLTKIKKHLPNAIVDLVVSEISVSLLNNFENVGEVLGLKRYTPLMKQLSFYWKLRKKKYDVVFVQEVNTHYTLMAKLTGTKYIISYINQYSFLQNVTVERKGHAVEAEQKTVNYLFDDNEIAGTALKLSEDEIKDGEQLLNQNGIKKDDLIICIHPGCSEQNSVRDWINERFASLCNRLINDFNAKIIFTGINKDKPDIDEIRSLVNSNTINFCDKLNLRQAAAIYSFCTLVIGPDTGTLHMANAVGTPILMLMGYADEKDTGPYDLTGRSKAVHVELDCLPCKHIEPKPERWDICKNKRPVICMEMLSVEQVYNEASKIINKRLLV
ncbi:MAG: glycosyltransferase family 9 protein [Syntrophothermus sp.]